MVDATKYILGFECLDGPPVIQVWNSPANPSRLQIRFGWVRFTDKDIWGKDRVKGDKVVLTLDTEVFGAFYYAYSDEPLKPATFLWKRSLANVQNQDLAPFMTWL